MSTTKIGDIGEQIVKNYLTESNWLVYQAPKDKAHLIDWILVTPDMKNMAIADAKTKPRRKHYPDTGIDYRHYLRYKNLQDKYNVDAFMRKMYGNMLSELTKQVNVNGQRYPLHDEYHGNIIYFPLVQMTQISMILGDHADLINELSNKKYKYDSSLEFEFTVQPALLDAPFKPKQRKVKTRNRDNPIFLQRILVEKICTCGIDELNPKSHHDYCEYKELLLKGQEK